MELLEKELGRLEGVRRAKVRGPTDDDMYYYILEILESKPLLPSRLKKLAARLEDYPYLGMVVKGIPGTVERTGDRLSFVARGSGVRYSLKPNDALRRRLAEGKTRLTLGGKVTEAGEPPRAVLEVTTVRETHK